MVASIAAMDDLPGSLRLTSTFPFVGRSAELNTLRALVPRAEGEGRRVVLLGGEPGSGKSRLVREFAAEAADDGVRVLYGACDAVVRTPYGPFVEALDHLARTADPAQLRAALGTGGGELTRPLPDLPARGGDPGAGPPELAKAIGELTGGNAFLVCELWRALVETDAVELVDGTLRLTRSPTDLGTPESVREVVSERLARLAPGTIDLLELAAAVGGEFELDVVRRAAGVADSELL